MNETRRPDFLGFLAERIHLDAATLSELVAKVLCRLPKMAQVGEPEKTDVMDRVLKELTSQGFLDLPTLIQAAEDYYDGPEQSAQNSEGQSHQPSDWWAELDKLMVSRTSTSEASPTHSPAPCLAQTPEKVLQLPDDGSVQSYDEVVELLPEVSDPSQYKIYLDVWQNDKKHSLDQNISRISRELHIASEDDITRDLGAIAEEFQFCQRCAEDCGLLLSGQLLETAHGICSLAIAKGIQLNDEELSRFEFCLLRCIDVVWELRTFVANGGDERKYWQNPVSRQNFITVRSDLTALAGSLTPSHAA